MGGLLFGGGLILQLLGFWISIAYLTRDRELSAFMIIPLLGAFFSGLGLSWPDASDTYLVAAREFLYSNWTWLLVASPILAVFAIAGKEGQAVEYGVTNELVKIVDLNRPPSAFWLALTGVTLVNACMGFWFNPGLAILVIRQAIGGS